MGILRLDRSIDKISNQTAMTASNRRGWLEKGNRSEKGKYISKFRFASPIPLDLRLDGFGLM